MTDPTVLERARQWALELRRLHRTELAQNHLSPTDSALLNRLVAFLEGPPQPDRAQRARQWGLDLRRHHRQELAQNHMSPTDSALLTRVVTFLENDLASAPAPGHGG